ncbi:MAG: hypothetical protein WC091_17520 [Sulfuricellaceae bacterium]
MMRRVGGGVNIRNATRQPAPVLDFTGHDAFTMKRRLSLNAFPQIGLTRVMVFKVLAGGVHFLGGGFAFSRVLAAFGSGCLDAINPRARTGFKRFCNRRLWQLVHGNFFDASIVGAGRYGTAVNMPAVFSR